MALKKPSLLVLLWFSLLSNFPFKTVNAQQANFFWIYNSYNSNLGADYIKLFRKDKTKNTWICFDGGINHYAAREAYGTLCDFSVGTAPAVCSNIIDFAIDSMGHIWLPTLCYGTQPYGPLYEYYGAWQQYDLASPLKALYTGGIGIDNSRLWISAPYDGVYVHHVGTNIWDHYNTHNTAMPDSTIYDVAIDKFHNKWMACNKGLIRYNDTTWMLYDTTNSPLQPYSLQDGNLIIDTLTGKLYCLAGYYSNGGVYVKDKNAWTHYTKANSGLLSNAVYDIYFDGDSATWFSSSRGVSYLKKDGSWQAFTGPYLSSSFDVRSVTRDSIGRLWFGTYGKGLIVYTNWGFDLPGGFTGGEQLVGVAEVKNKDKAALNLYYNNQNITVENTGPEPKNVRLDLLNVLGSIVFSTGLALPSHTGQSVNIPLPEGFYIAQAIDIKNQQACSIKLCASKP